MFDVLTAFLLGVVEGFTEFLPISSTGHLILAEKFLNFKDSKDIFTVVIQLGAVVAVLWFYRTDLLQKTRGLFARDRESLNFWKFLLLGTIPAGLIGLAIESKLDSLSNPTVVAWALIIGGIILWLVDRKPDIPASDHEQTIDFKQLSTGKALLIGLGQSVAIIPGVSRSGATIVSGLAAGLNRPTATAFSFYLSIPILVMASGLKLVKYSDTVHTIPGGFLSILVGLIAAFVTALLSITWLLHYVSRHNFRPFAYYRIAVGVIILGLLGFGVL